MVVGGLLGGGWWALAEGVDVCLFNVLFGQPLSGKVVRAL